MTMRRWIDWNLKNT